MLDATPTKEWKAGSRDGWSKHSRVSAWTRWKAEMKQKCSDALKKVSIQTRQQRAMRKVLLQLSKQEWALNTGESEQSWLTLLTSPCPGTASSIANSFKQQETVAQKYTCDSTMSTMRHQIFLFTFLGKANHLWISHDCLPFYMVVIFSLTAL